MSYYHIIKIIFVNPQTEYAWPLETDTAKKFPDPIKYKYVNKFYHEKVSCKNRGISPGISKKELNTGS